MDNGGEGASGICQHVSNIEFDSNVLALTLSLFFSLNLPAQPLRGGLCEAGELLLLLPSHGGQIRHVPGDTKDPQ